MVVISRWLHVPRPRTFLYVMTLQTGAEMIALSMLFNKFAGFYGLLAILTGFKLNATQLTLYIYSLCALIFLGVLMSHIRRQSPLECLALAWFYIFDTMINTIYSFAIGITWFLMNCASGGEDSGTILKQAYGSSTVSVAAAFESPVNAASKVYGTAAPAAAMADGQQGIADGAVTVGSSAGSNLAEGIPSIIFIVLLHLVRIYFIFIMMAFARQAIRRYTQGTSISQHFQMVDGEEESSSNPFAVDAPHGQGWRGKLGRIMVSMGKSYWLSGSTDDDWTRDVNKRFKVPALQHPSLPGTIERERRARSGTGPPRPAAEALAAQV